MKGECQGCGLTRALTRFEGMKSPSLNEPDQELCASCADVHGVPQLRMDYVGRLLLTVNSKLDLLRVKPKRGKR